MSSRFDEFLHHQNVSEYQQQLADGKHETSRKVLLDLLAEEAVQARKAEWSPIYREVITAEPRACSQHGQAPR